MTNLKWISCVVSVSALLVACGGGSDGAGGASTGGDTGSGGTSSSGGSSSTGGSASSGAGGTGASDSRSYGSVFRSLTEVCDILSFGQREKMRLCDGREAPEGTSGPYPSNSCPDILFSEGSTRVRTIEEAWACVDEWAALSCQDLFEGKMPACVSAGTLSAGAPCVAPSQCQSLDCIGVDPGASCGICGAVGDGVTCDEQTACRGFDYCDGGVCIPSIPDPNGPQVPPALSGPDEACEDGTCVEGYVCAANDTLDARICRPTRSGGQPCYVWSGSVPENGICSNGEDGVFCDLASLTCRAPGNLGEACAFDGYTYRCVAGAGCNGLGICALPGGPGTPCLTSGWTYSSGCGTGELCDAGMCKTMRNYGEPCADLLTEVCTGSGTCESGVCTPNDTLTWMGELCEGQ